MMKEIALPEPQETGALPLEKILRKRRSIRDFDPKREVSIKELSTLLYATYGITDKVYSLKTAPSAGALYPLNVYVSTKEGLYLYIPQKHSLVQKKSQDIRKKIARASLYQDFIADACLVFIFVAIYERTTYKYGKRGIRYVHLDAGHSAQNLLLQATALGMGGCPVGAFDDETLKKILSIDEGEVIYVIPVGFPSRY